MFASFAMPIDGNDVLKDLNCPICMELLYKPCVSTTCGHVFCFWCFHMAMNGRWEPDPHVSPIGQYCPTCPGLRKSSCPLCRSSYSHFPKICSQLHSFIESAHPEEYRKRRSEVAEDEVKQGVESPSMETTGPPSLAEFACVKCHGVPAIQPAFLSCGHLVCSSNCSPPPGDDGLTR